MNPKVLVAGGGIAGLSCAWRLASNGFDVQVFEAQAQAGGNVRTEAEDGFLLERGPHTFMRSADDIFDLAREVGIQDKIVASRPAAKKRFIVRDGRLHKVFTGPLSFLSSRLLSLRGKLKLMGEPFRTRQRGDPGDTAVDFFTRRFGPEAASVLAGAFISGVYAGDPRSLSAPAAFPLFWRFEQESGSMVRGALRLRKERKRIRRESGVASDPRPKGLFSFAQGLGQLTDAVANKLGDRCHTGAKIQALARDPEGFVVKTDQAEIRAAHLVVAVPPSEAGRLLSGLDAELGRAVGSVPMAPVAVAYLGHRARAGQIPDGFGFLAPRGEGIRTLGVLFPSRLFDGRAPGGGDLLTGYLGGMLDPEALDLDDAGVLGQVQADLRLLTGSSADAVFAKVARYPEAIPQFTRGHLDRMETIRLRLREIPGLALAGNYLRGVGMKDAVGSGFEAASELMT